MLTDIRISVFLIKDKGKLHLFITSTVLYQIIHLRIKQFLRNLLFKHFPIKKHIIHKLASPYTRLKSMQGQHLKILCRTFLFLNALYKG